MAARAARLVVEIVGMGALLVYLAGALGFQPIIGTERVTLALVFAIGPVAMVAVLGIHELLRASPSVFLLRVGTTFLIIAFAFFNLMLVVQQMVRLQFRDLRMAAAGDPSQAALLDAVFRGTNLVQLGTDVSFDVFYCLGIIALSLVMYRERSFGRLVGVLGVISAAALLVFNLATFPYAPAESGLVDLGPLTGLWWLLVIIQVKRAGDRPPGSRSTESSRSELTVRHKGRLTISIRTTAVALLVSTVLYGERARVLATPERAGVEEAADAEVLRFVRFALRDRLLAGDIPDIEIARRPPSLRY